ncbi:MAG: hypothetical protein ACREQ7_12800 [Candidatus Binatia bacterium]
MSRKKEGPGGEQPPEPKDEARCSDSISPRARSQALKPNLRIVKPAKAVLRLGGPSPSDDMAPGTYLVKCETGWLEPIGKGHRAVLQFSVVDGLYGGTALRMWIPAADAGGIVKLLGRYAKYCTIALGRPVESDDPVAEPGQIFSAKFFQVQVGFRKTDRPRGGQFSAQNALKRKDALDYLRVHEILSREDLP